MTHSEHVFAAGKRDPTKTHDGLVLQSSWEAPEQSHEKDIIPLANPVLFDVLVGGEKLMGGQWCEVEV